MHHYFSCKEVSVLNLSLSETEALGILHFPATAAIQNDHLGIVPPENDFTTEFSLNVIQKSSSQTDSAPCGYLERILPYHMERRQYKTENNCNAGNGCSACVFVASHFLLCLLSCLLRQYPGATSEYDRKDEISLCYKWQKVAHAPIALCTTSI
jgi:hypothetical protein